MPGTSSPETSLGPTTSGPTEPPTTPEPGSTSTDVPGVSQSTTPVNITELKSVIDALNAVVDKIDEITGTYRRSVTCSQFIDDIEKLISISQLDSSPNTTEIVELSNVIAGSDVDACTAEDILQLQTHKLSLENLISQYSITITTEPGPTEGPSTPEPGTSGPPPTGSSPVAESTPPPTGSSPGAESTPPPTGSSPGAESTPPPTGSIHKNTPQ